MLEWIISSAVLTAVVIVLRLLLKGKMSLRLQYALWAVVLVRLLVPFSFGSTAVSVQNVVDRPAAETPKASNTFEYGMQNDIQIDIQIEPVIDEETKSQLTYPGTTDPQALDKINKFMEEVASRFSTEVSAEAQHLTVNEILNIVWACGAGLIALWLLITNLHFYRKLRRSRERLELDGAPLPVFVTDRIDTPCLFGLIRPKIYVTPEVAQDAAVLRYSIEHEATHRRHGDHIWAILRGLCLAVHWYNPLVWIAAILSRKDAELACDEATIKRIGEEHRADYGYTLLQLTCEKRPAIFVAATTMTGSGRSIKERIKLIVKKPKTAIITLIAIVLIVAIAVGCTFTGAKTGEETEKTTAPTETTAERGELDVSDVSAFLDAIDLTETTLTFQAASFPSDDAIHAAEYLEALKTQFSWEADRTDHANLTDDLNPFVQLVTPHATFTFYLNENGETHIETKDAEGWFLPQILRYDADMQTSVYNKLLSWYIEAEAASLYGGNARILTEKEIETFQRQLVPEQMNDYSGENGSQLLEIACFFTSHYSNVRYIDADAFLRYFPRNPNAPEVDEAEWDLVQEVEDWRFGEDNHLVTLDQLPVPVHRIPRTRVNEVLLQYAGITVEDMNTNWFEEVTYVPATDCFYNYTSDFGPGHFTPWFGIEIGDRIALWEKPGWSTTLPLRLDLIMTDDGWQILSFGIDGYESFPSERGELDASDIPAILDAIDLREATLTRSGEEAAYPASAAIGAERYLEEIKQYTWKPFPSLGTPDYEEFGYRRLSTPHTTITFCGRNRATGWLVQIETDDAEGWFLSPTIDGDDPWSGARAGSEMDRWYEEAEGAVLYGGEGRLLTAEELEFFRDYALYHSAFFISHYSDVRDMNAWGFLYYFSGETFEPENEAERQILTGIKFVNGDTRDYSSPEGEPAVRIHRADVDAYLTQYAGVTVEEMHTNWFEDVTYLPETDCFYIGGAYAGPARFYPAVGVQNGSTVTLWARGLDFDLEQSNDPFDRLTLEKSGDGWRVVSYLSEDGRVDTGVDALTPHSAIEALFVSGDASVTLGYSDGSKWKTYLFDAASDKTHLLTIADSFNWTLEDARYSPKASFRLTAVSADGTKRVIFRPDGGAGTLDYDDGTVRLIWRATPADKGYSSFIWSVRSNYDSKEYGEALYNTLSFRCDGSAEEVVEYFAATAFFEMNESLAPDSTRRMDDFEITGWRVSSVVNDSDKPEINASLWYAYTPRGPENTMPPDLEGSGEYAGKVVGSLIFVLQQQDDDCWKYIYGLK